MSMHPATLESAARLPTDEAEWEALLRVLPGYDPFAQAGDCFFSDERALRAIGFFHEVLTHVKGTLAGRPLYLEPWQLSLVANLFGWTRPDETRRYREAFVYVPRKNGKSVMVAGLCLYALGCDGEIGAEIYGAATDRDQARLVFDYARGMVYNEPVLGQRYKVYRGSGQLAITCEDTMSSYKVIDAQAKDKHGFNGHMIVIDELHGQDTRELVDVLTTSTGSRRQPITVYITTADYLRESICNEVYDYACSVRDNTGDELAPGYDPSFLPVIYEAHKDDDWTDPDVWKKANPNFGVSVTEEYIARECRKAQARASYRNTFKRLHLNIRTAIDIDNPFAEKWPECGAREGEPTDPIEWRKWAQDALSERRCFAGMDLSSKTDLSAIALVFPPVPRDRSDQVSTDGEPVAPSPGSADDRLWYVLPWFWMPSEKLFEREHDDGVPFLAWVEHDLIQVTDGASIDYRRIRSFVRDVLMPRFAMTELAFDPWNAEQICHELADDGLEMVEFRQGYPSMNPPTKRLEAIVLDRQIDHGDNPVLRWMAENTVVTMDPAGNMKPDKSKVKHRIDGIVASIMGIGRAMEGLDDGRSVYDDGESLFL